MCWEFIFKEILPIPRLAVHMENYIIGSEIFKRLLFPMSMDNALVEKQLYEFKNILMKYYIKDIRKAIVNSTKDDNIFNVENKIKIERDFRSRCCINRYRSSCKYKLCDCCCMDPECIHFEEMDNDSFTDTITDTDSEMSTDVDMD
jgi:hypothetical protein